MHHKDTALQFLRWHWQQRIAKLRSCQWRMTSCIDKLRERGGRQSAGNWRRSRAVQLCASLLSIIGDFGCAAAAAAADPRRGSVARAPGGHDRLSGGGRGHPRRRSWQSIDFASCNLSLQRKVSAQRGARHAATTALYCCSRRRRPNQLRRTNERTNGRVDHLGLFARALSGNRFQVGSATLLGFTYDTCSLLGLVGIIDAGCGTNCGERSIHEYASTDAFQAKLSARHWRLSIMRRPVFRAWLISYDVGLLQSAYVMFRVLICWFLL